jgi:hypothetical protein
MHGVQPGKFAAEAQRAQRESGAGKRGEAAGEANYESLEWCEKGAGEGPEKKAGGLRFSPACWRFLSVNSVALW